MTFKDQSCFRHDITIILVIASSAVAMKATMHVANLNSRSSNKSSSIDARAMKRVRTAGLGRCPTLLGGGTCPSLVDDSPLSAAPSDYGQDWRSRVGYQLYYTRAGMEFTYVSLMESVKIASPPSYSSGLIPN